MNRIYLPLFSLFLLLMGCRSSKIIQPETAGQTSYSIVYVIHGDANYLYHNAEGNALQADEEALKDAQTVAKNATKGEIFIFHQKPERKILWLFPKKDRRFLYYRNGELVHDKKYSPASDEKSFAAETNLYNKYRTANGQPKSSKKIFLYYGHEIPFDNNGVYHYSRSNAAFNTEIFANGVRSFLHSKEDSFDLTVLSTCNNGTPAMVEALTPFSDYVLASPQNLHLSHIDSEPLAMLENASGDVPIPELADSLAVQTYNRLTSFLQTVVTLSVYNTNATRSYLPSLAENYQNYLSERPNTKTLTDNTDCANFSFYNSEKFEKGIKVWFKPPRFGQKANSSEYSGWGCKEKGNH